MTLKLSNILHRLLVSIYID